MSRGAVLDSEPLTSFPYCAPLQLVNLLLNGDLEDSHNLGQRARVVMEERLAEVVEVLGAELKEVDKLLPLDLLHHVLLVEGLLEGRLGLASLCSPDV